MTLALLNSSAAPFITEQVIRFAIPSAPFVIEKSASYIASMFENCDCAEKSRSLSLVLEEALSNSIFHGNLETSPMQDDYTPSGQDASVTKPAGLPNTSRKVHLTVSYKSSSLIIVIRDEGKGFDWRKVLSSANPASGNRFDSGLKIIMAFSSCVSFNDLGNEITIRMDGVRLRHSTCPFKHGH